MQFRTGKKHLTFLQQTLTGIVLMLFFSITVPAQNTRLMTRTTIFQLNPVLHNALRNTRMADPLLAEYLKPNRYELMRWPNYPLTAAQIAARDKKNNQSIGRQITNELIDSYVNSLLYGKKAVPATVPKF